MPLRDSDLTPELRRILRGRGLDVRSRAPSKVSRAEGSTADSRMRCHPCRLAGTELVDTVPRLERHLAEAHGGGRMECVL